MESSTICRTCKFEGYHRCFLDTKCSTEMCTNLVCSSVRTICSYCGDIFHECRTHAYSGKTEHTDTSGRYYKFSCPNCR